MSAVRRARLTALTAPADERLARRLPASRSACGLVGQVAGLGMDLGQKVTDLVRQLSSIGDSIRSCADGSGTGAGQQRVLSALGAVRRADSLAGGMAIRLRSLASPTSTLGWSTSSTKA